MILYQHTPAAWLVFAAVALAAAVCLLSFRWVAPRPRRAAALPVLRLALLALLGWCLLMPGRSRVRREVVKPRFLVVLDRSASMHLRADAALPTRWETALTALAQPWTDVLDDTTDLVWYRFAGDLVSAPAAATRVAGAPDGDTTRLRDALRRLSSRYAGLPVAGCLLLTDGLDTHEAIADWAFEPRPFPIFTLRLEPDGIWEEEPDVRIASIDTPRRVTAGWKTDLTAVVAGQGTGGQPFTVQLFRDDRLLQEQPVTIPREGGAREVVFPLDHPEPGAFLYRVAAPPLPGETHTNDNQMTVSVQVITTRNHLLYVEGSPRWESKYLTRVLRANTRTTPLIFLRGPDDRLLSVGERGSMTADLRAAELAFFKIVILGNLDADELGDARAANLVAYVENGGSLILLGGSRAWGERGWIETPLTAAMPVRRIVGRGLEGAFAVDVTDAGLAHPAFAGDADFWASLPPILSVLGEVELTAGASVLVAARTPAGRMPVVVSHRYGQGRVATVFTDSLWRWQLDPASLRTAAYRRFWDQLVDWMLPEDEDTLGPGLVLTADREQFHVGEDIVLSVRPPRDDAGPVTCRVTGPDGREVAYAMSPREVSTASGETFDGLAAVFEARVPGLYTATAEARIADRPAVSDALTFFVNAHTPESVRRPADLNVLRALASSGGGRHFETVEELNRFLSALTVDVLEDEVVAHRSLWRNWAVLGGLLTLLAAGWILRKAMGMP